MGATPCCCARTPDLTTIIMEDEECRAAAAGLHPTMVERRPRMQRRGLLCRLLGHRFVPWQPVATWRTDGVTHHAAEQVRSCRRCGRWCFR